MTNNEAIESANDNDLFGDVVFTYSRQDAIDDGVLIDVTEIARKEGFKIHTAMTSTLYGELTGGCNCTEPVQFAMRVLYKLIMSGCIRDTDRIDGLKLIGGNGNVCDAYALIHGGDRGEPCLTVMLVGED